MAVSLKHGFTSAKSDGTDPTLVQPSHWNSEHVLTAAVNKLLGTDGSSTTVQEIACTAAGRALIDDNDAAAQKVTMNVAEIPIGGGFEWFGSSLPTGNGSVVWAWANGQAINRTTFAAAFAIFGTAYGAGDGSTTFNLPDKRGRVFAGKDDMGGAGAASRLTTAGSGIDGATLGATGGAQNRVIAQANLPAVGLSVSGSCSASGSCSGVTDIAGTGITVTLGAFGGYLSGGGLGAATGPGAATSATVNDPTHQHGFNGSASVSGSISGSTSALGSGTAYNVTQPTQICNYVVRVA